MRSFDPKYPWRPTGSWDKCPACFEVFDLEHKCNNCGSGHVDYTLVEPTDKTQKHQEEIKWLKESLLAESEENESLRQQLEATRLELITAYGENEELSGQLADATVDVKRMNFLTTRAYVAINPHKQCLWVLRGIKEVDYQPSKIHGFTAAVDAAMKESKDATKHI